jgi:hypothetical protein
MVGTPVRVTNAVLADRVTTDMPVKLGSAATPTTAVADAGVVASPMRTAVCNPKIVDVTKLPNVMDHNGFARGAILLRKWLSLPASISPIFAAIDTTTITMDFVLGFDRAKKQFDRIFSEKLYMTPKAQAQIARLLKRLGKDRGGSFDYNKPVEQLDPGPEPVQSFDIQTVEVGSILDPLDGLTAALGRFTLKLVVAGHVDPEAGTGRWRVTLTDVGVHVEDRFDFEGSQVLGCWNICTNEIGRVTCGGITYTNADFRDFRMKSSKGGDIWVLSDVKTTSLQPPASFLLP